MIDTAKRERKWRHGIATEAKVSPESVDPTHESLLETIERKSHDLARVTQQTVEGGSITNVARQNPIKLLFKRVRGKGR